MRRGLARLVGAGAAIASLGACATIAAPGVTPLDRASAAYTHLQAAADRALPLLPADKARRVRVILALIGAGLDVARRLGPDRPHRGDRQRRGAAGRATRRAARLISTRADAPAIPAEPSRA